VGDGSSRWKTFGERTIYDNPWVWLGQVDVERLEADRARNGHGGGKTPREDQLRGQENCF
jgi:hypothetical protein